MIRNSHQYQVTKSWVEKFQQAIVSLYENYEQKQKYLEGWQLIIDSYFAQIRNLQVQIAEYESLLDHNPKHPFVFSTSNTTLDELGNILIKVRLAKKITEKELAVLTKLTEVQIKEFEKQDYQNASFDSVIEVTNALGIKLQHCVLVAENQEFMSKELMVVRQSELIRPNS